MQLTILMPCLDEAETIGTCIGKANAWADRSGIETEILVADNGSTDGSQEIARSLGARVVQVSQRGYGAALYHGSVEAKGEWIIMGDSDNSYDFSNLDLFVEKLRQGYDLVMGNRFRGGIAPGAMPWKNRYVGNPLLTAIGRLLFASPVGDFHCGLRGYRCDAFRRMDLRTTGMEYATEMVIKATVLGMRICEVPTTLAKDGRSRPPHLRPWRDGWRHLRFMMLFSPRWLFIVPGTTVLIPSLLVYLALLIGPMRVGNIVFDIDTLLFSQAGIILGSIAITTGVSVRLFGIREGLLHRQPLLEWVWRSPILEIGGLFGTGLILLGILSGLAALSEWASAGFGLLVPGHAVRIVSVSTLLFILGGIVLTTSLVIGFLSLPMRRAAA